MSAKKRSKYSIFHELLGALGNGIITVESFWKRMEQEKLTDKDIDDYCNGTISAKNPDGFLR